MVTAKEGQQIGDQAQVEKGEYWDDHGIHRPRNGNLNRLTVREYIRSSVFRFRQR